MATTSESVGPDAALRSHQATARPARINWIARTFDSLESRPFRFLWLGMLLSMGGFQMQMIARGILVYQIQDNAFIASVVAMGFAPSLLVVSLFGGVIGDRFERRSIIQFAQFMIGFIALVIGVLLVFDVIHWLHLLGASIAQGAMFALQMPARQAAIPTLVGKERMGNAIALNAAAMGLMNLLGPALGGLIYGVFGPEAVYFTVAVMGLIAVLLTGFVPRLYPPVNAARKSAVNNIRDGFSYIQKNKLVRILIIQSVIIAVLSMPVRMLIPVFAKDVYGSNEAQVGYMAAAAGIGALVGSLGIANIREGQRRGLVVLASAILSGISILLLGSVPVYVLGVAVMVGVGLGESGRWALGQALIMEKTDDEYRARVMSVVMMTFGLLPLGVLPLGAAIEAFGADTAVIGMAVMLLVAGTLFLMFSRNVRQLS